MSSEIIGVIGIIALFILLAMRLYIGMAMMVVGFVGTYFLIGLDPALELLALLPMNECKAYTLSVIPLFILLGQFSFISGISSDIYKTFHTWLGHRRGGLAMATIIACAFFAAVSGSSLATAATMGMVAIPEMRKYKYNASLATGTVASGGTLGILIPPSIGFVIYGILTEQSIGKLLMSGVLPGLMLTLLFMSVIYVSAIIKPSLAPRGPKTTLKEKIKSLSGTWGMLLLLSIIMAGFYTGIATPTEVAGVGALAALLLVVFKKKLTFKTFVQSLAETGKMTAFIFLIIIGASIFSYFLALTGIPTSLSSFITSLSVPTYVILIGIIFVYIILGCVMEVFSVMILTLPIIFPIVQAFNFDPIWFGVIVVIVLEIGFITPPIGLNVFILKGAAPDIPIETMFKGIWPFLLMAVVAIIILFFFPQIALFIPSQM